MQLDAAETCSSFVNAGGYIEASLELSLELHPSQL